MKKITDISIQVAFLHRGEDISRAEVLIPIGDIQEIKAENLLDACQRSVAHCVEELQKVLDSQ